MDLPQACEMANLASRKIVDTANTLCSGVQTLNGHQLAQITSSTQELMNGCIQVRNYLPACKQAYIKGPYFSFFYPFY